MKNRTPKLAWAQMVAENERPWEPMPGYRKRRCAQCRLWFAQPPNRTSEYCLDCDPKRRTKGDTHD